MATQHSLQRFEMEVLQEPSSSESSQPTSSEGMPSCRTSTSEVLERKSYSSLFVPSLPLPRLHCPKVDRFEKTNPRPFQTKYLSKTPSILSSQPPESEGSSSFGQLAGETGHSRCLSTCSCKCRFPAVPSLPLEGRVFPVCRNALRPLYSSGSFSGADEPPSEGVPSARDKLSGLLG